MEQAVMVRASCPERWPNTANHVALGSSNEGN